MENKNYIMWGKLTGCNFDMETYIQKYVDTAV